MHTFDNAFHELVQSLKSQVDDIKQDINIVCEMLHALTVKQGVLSVELERMMSLSEARSTLSVSERISTPEEISVKETVAESESSLPSINNS